MTIDSAAKAADLLHTHGNAGRNIEDLLCNKPNEAQLRLAVRRCYHEISAAVAHIRNHHGMPEPDPHVDLKRGRAIEELNDDLPQQSHPTAFTNAGFRLFGRQIFLQGYIDPHELERFQRLARTHIDIGLDISFPAHKVFDETVNKHSSRPEWSPRDTTIPVLPTDA